MSDSQDIKAEVIAVFPDKVKISVGNISAFANDKSLKVGSYLRVTDSEDCALIAIIENFCIEVNDKAERRHIIEALPLGIIADGKFIRGGDTLTIPPTGVSPATDDDIKKIFEDSVDPAKKFAFSALVSNDKITVPVDGDRFFNKHLAVVGSTGAGKSHTIAKIIQMAVSAKNGQYSLNNSHVVIFDIHSEYRTAFPDANFLDASTLTLPYWLLNSEELEEVLLDTGERDNYNQSAVFRQLVTENKKRHNTSAKNVFYDSPLKFNIHEVLNALYNIKSETVNSKNEARYMVVDGSYTLLPEGKTDTSHGLQLSANERLDLYFAKRLDFHPTKGQSITPGSYADKSLDKFFARFEAKVEQDRLQFLFGPSADTATLVGTLKSLIGYGDEQSNVTIVDLSGVPFEVLSITVSLISRILFEYGYHYKVMRTAAKEKINTDTPLLLVYEEAHKYVPNSDLARFRASKFSIERIAKEGRKYGVTLLLSSQRPSEISETIFSQCSNFLAMRLTNPSDQSYVARLLPDTLGNLCDKLPTLGAGEALLIGESVVMPSLVKVERCDPPPSSTDIPYYQLWKEEWKQLNFEAIKKAWLKE
ncbi:ATP-binding protein [Burkholderia vietnamiensis]|jgi:DNA helicase HerA-like ATPase|uniref:ATP-binding protein n=2 Tax=Burkholderia cepacia complex TaxID=87882 RepID=A0AAW7T8R4_BURVI|nr:MULTISPECIES: anti-phage-associated helicase HerA [Burkholderiaceae]KVR74409.1 Bipolar DNA helicase [Burkholderia vietnamiensis]KVS03080.1 Bipolar DNA helicase [Burkholderia vietnamiensis]KVS32294.1 Bipolar DNA helicase [Burkholderia vietnamiensis]MBH9647810.1 ATP-binding protein [Burkholderia vietnamiensis]MBR7912051.1 ATP-binding protein [Burkholderia vietnamiensis]